MLSSGTLRSRFHEYSHTQRLFGERDTVIAAVSGGVDSMVLLDLLAQEGGLRLIVAHFNHHLRGLESNADETFVAERALWYGAEFYVDGADTESEARRLGMGIQEVARNLRYTFFRMVRERSGAARVATAHHADDNAETVLLHLFRGTGVQGMAGIPVLRLNDGICRPLLFARREEIELYAREEQIPFRSDSSNEKDAYARNALRHRILPLVTELITPSVVENITRSAEHFRAAAEHLAAETRVAVDSAVSHRTADSLGLSLARLLALPDLLRHSVLMAATEDITGRRPESIHVSAMLGMIGKIAGTRVMLPAGFEAIRAREELLIRRCESHAEFRITVEPDRDYTVGGYRFSSRYVETAGPLPGIGRSVEYVDADRLTRRGLTLRTWKEGDAFIPLGMSTRKKVSDFFVDEKIPLHEKHFFPILETDDGEIVWICGRRIDDRFKITEATRHVLKLEFSAASHG